MLKCQCNHQLGQSTLSAQSQGRLSTSSLVLIQQEAREGAVLPGAAIDGTAVQTEPHLVSLKEGQDGVVACRLVIWGAIIGVCGHHYFLVAH